jgi:uridine phosphorylase
MNKDKLNPYFLHLQVDYLYHLGLDNTLDLGKMFSAVKHVVIVRSNEDAAITAQIFAKKIYSIHDKIFNLTPLYKTERFHFYHVGNVIIVSSGIGMPSILICLNEITKLLVYAQATEFTFFQICPAGGVGIDEGSIVISETALNSNLEPYFTSIECGVEYKDLTNFNPQIIKNFSEAVGKGPLNNIFIGKTIAAYDYYDEQARLDGFLELNYTKEEQYTYLKQAQKIGVLAINMDNLAFAWFCNKLEIPAIAINAIVVNRLNSDEVVLNKEQQTEVIEHAASLCEAYVSRLIV